MTRFSGETAWDAFVNDNGLDIVEEEAFLDWLRQRVEDVPSWCEGEFQAHYEEWAGK